jgi:hypothetical protein
LIIGFDKNLVLNDKNGNSLVLDKGVKSDSGGIEVAIPIQPQIDTTSPAATRIRVISDVVWALVLVLILVSFGAKVLFGTGMSFLLALINSQQNLAYIPIMSINMPGIISKYLKSLLAMSTFDPLPYDSVRSLLGLDFKWTENESMQASVQRINIKDRIFLNVLGFVFFALVIFLFAQLLALLLSPFVSVPHVRRVHDLLKFSGKMRPLILSFYIVLYLDLLIGGYVNTENEYLLAVPANWGPRGYLPFGD